MIVLAVGVALITTTIVLAITSGWNVGTALLKLKIGERYEVKAYMEHESSDEKKGSAWLMLLEDHKRNVRSYKISKEKLPEISAGDAIILMTSGKIHHL